MPGCCARGCGEAIIPPPAPAKKGLSGCPIGAIAIGCWGGIPPAAGAPKRNGFAIVV